MAESNDWRKERKAMLEVLKYQTERSLKNIAKCFKTTGESFDDTFSTEFFRMIDHTIKLTYYGFLAEEMECQTQNQQSLNQIGHSSQNQQSVVLFDGKGSVCNDENETKSTIKMESNEISMRHDGDSRFQIFNPIDGAYHDESTSKTSDALPARIPPDRSQTVRQYECHLCHYVGHFRSTLNKHMHKHIGNSLFKCHVCSKSFPYQCTLKVHLRIHTGEKPFKCDVCSKAFRYKYNLKTHTRKHSDKQPFTCHICLKRFTQSNNLKAHIRTIHKQ